MAHAGMMGLSIALVAAIRVHLCASLVPVSRANKVIRSWFSFFLFFLFFFFLWHSSQDGEILRRRVMTR